MTYDPQRMRCVAVRTSVAGRADSQLVGYIWLEGGRYRFCYYPVYRLAPFSVPISPVTLAFSGDETDSVYTAATDGQLDGPLRVFDNMVAGPCADLTCFAWLGEVAGRILGAPPSRRFQPLDPLARLVWSTALRPYTNPLFGLSFTPEPPPPSVTIEYMPRLERNTQSDAFWSRVKQEVQRLGDSPASINLNLFARAPSALLEHRRWVLPLPGTEVRFRYDVTDPETKRTVPGYISAESMGGTVRAMRIKLASLALARDCGIDVIPFHSQLAPDGRHFMWRAAILGRAPREPSPLFRRGYRDYTGAEDHPLTPVVPVSSGLAVPYALDDDPLMAKDGWMRDTLDARAYEGHPPATALVAIANRVIQMGDEFVDKEEAFRRVAFSVLGGLYTHDRAPILMRAQRMETGGLFERRVAWRLAPMATCTPSLCPYKTASVMSARLVQQAIGYASKLHVTRAFAINTVQDMVKRMMMYQRYAEDFHLNGDEVEPSRPVVAFTTNGIWSPPARRRGRKPAAVSLSRDGPAPDSYEPAYASH